MLPCRDHRSSRTGRWRSPLSGPPGASARVGVGLEGLSLHSYTGTTTPGLVIGCGSLPEPAIDHALKLLTSTLNHSTPTHHQISP